MKNTKIEWATHTANFWSGCTKVSSGCANCYAASLSNRAPKTLGGWGPGAPRRRHLPILQEVRKWNREAAGAAERPRVFVNSLSDWLDHEVPVEWLAAALETVHECQHLDFLLLTKRPQLWRERIEAAIEHLDNGPYCGPICAWLEGWLRGYAPRNVWAGTTVEDQERADERIPHLLKIPARVRFLSCEPLLGPVDLDRWVDGVSDDGSLKPLTGYASGDGCYVPWTDKAHRIHWVICGGESGPKARPMHPDWARSLRDQSKEAGVAFFMKQMGGTRKPFPNIPDDLDVRQFPEAQP